jgi:hypothetical protein
MLLRTLKAKGLSKASMSSELGLPWSDGRPTKQLDDKLDLVESGLAGKESLADDHFTHDAPDRPNIDGLGVLLGAKDDLGCSVPAGGDVLGEDMGCVVFDGGDGAGQAKIGDLDSAVGIEEDVGGLEIWVRRERNLGG